MIFVIKQTRITQETNEFNFSLESVGFFNDKNMALSRIENNTLDLSDDGYYNFCCLMSFEEGLYSVQEDEQWFSWDYKLQKYCPCSKPNIFNNLGFFI